MFALESVARRIELLQPLPFCSELIDVKEFVLLYSPAVEINRALERELMGLVPHSIHHLAIIALRAKSFGHQMGTDFGKAPSAIVYELSAPSTSA